MSELGSGSGSSYPSALDTNAVLEVNSPSGSKTKARAEVPNDSMAAIVATQTELGTDPAGTLTDVKTYLQTEHEADGTHGDITTGTIVATGAISGTSISTGDAILKVKVIDIDDWNMQGTTSITVATGITSTNIRHISGMIRDDTSAIYYPLTPGYVTISTEVDAWIDAINMGTNLISLTRRASGQFDGAGFSTTSFNRGWITIWYV